MSQIGGELKEKIDFVEKKILFFLKNQNSYDVSHSKRKGVANDLIASALLYTIHHNQDAQCMKLLVRHLNYDAQIKLKMKWISIDVNNKGSKLDMLINSYIAHYKFMLPNEKHSLGFIST